MDAHITEENIGYQMAIRLGWITGSGLGRKNQGRTEPIPLVMKEDTLCLGRLKSEFEQADEATRNRRALEIEKEDTDELQQKYQNEQEKEKAIQESLKDLKEMFYCELCDKQYFKYKEYDNHINSYDHAHRQRLRELRQRESTRNIYAKKKKEQKQMEKELQRLHLISGKTTNESRPDAGFNTVFRSSSSASTSGFKPISVRGSFQAVPPPPPADFAPPLPREPAPPLPDEPVPPPPPPPPVDQQTKKPFSFKMGSSSGEQGLAETSASTTPAKLGLSFSLGKKKGVNVVQFGVKSKPAKTTASAFAESSSEEEEDEVQEEDTRVSFDNEQLTSTPTQQQYTLEKVIEYADTLRIKAALKPKLLIRFVKGTEQGGILPGTIPKSAESDEPKEETKPIARKFTEFKEKKEVIEKGREEDCKDSGNRTKDAKHRKKEERHYKERTKDYKEGKEYSERGNRSERTSDRREDKYNYRNSEDYEGRKELRKKESRDRKIERRSIKETGHVDEFSARKSYNKKNNSD